MRAHAQNGTDYSGKCFISHSAARKTREKSQTLWKTEFKKLDGRVLVNSIGNRYRLTSGPGTVALFFWAISVRTRDL